MRTIRIKTVIVLAGMFILGGIAGWVQGRHNPPVSLLRPATPRALEDHIMARLEKKLDLNSSQIRDIRPIIIPTSAKIAQAQNEMLDKIAAILAERDGQIAPLLNENQKKALSELQQQRKKFLGHSN